MWPVAESGRVASDLDPLGIRGCGTVKDEQHVPAGGADVDVGRRYDGTVVARACHLGEEDTGSHQVAMGAGGGSNKRDPHVCRGTLEEVDVDVVSLTVLPICLRNGVCGLFVAGGQIRRDVDFNSELLRVYCAAIRVVGLGVGSRDKDTTVIKEDGLGVIHAGNDGGVED